MCLVKSYILSDNILTTVKLYNNKKMYPPLHLVLNINAEFSLYQITMVNVLNRKLPKAIQRFCGRGTFLLDVVIMLHSTWLNFSFYSFQHKQAVSSSYNNKSNNNNNNNNNI